MKASRSRGAFVFLSIFAFNYRIKLLATGGDFFMPETQRPLGALGSLGYGHLYQLFDSASAPSPNGCAHTSPKAEAESTGKRCAHTSPAKARARTDSKCAHTSSKRRSVIPFRELARYEHREYNGRRLACSRVDCYYCRSAFVEIARAVNMVASSGRAHHTFAVINHLDPAVCSVLNEQVALVLRSARWRKANRCDLKFMLAFERHTQSHAVHLNVLANYDGASFDRVCAYSAMTAFCELLYERFERLGLVTQPFSADTVHITPDADNLANSATGLLYFHKGAASVKERAYLLGMNSGRVAAYTSRGFFRGFTRREAALEFRASRRQAISLFAELFPDEAACLERGHFISRELYETYRRFGIGSVVERLELIASLRGQDDLSAEFIMSSSDALISGEKSPATVRESIGRIRYWRGKVFAGMKRAGLSEDEAANLTRGFNTPFDFKYLAYVIHKCGGLSPEVLEQVQSNVYIPAFYRQSSLEPLHISVCEQLSQLTQIDIPQETSRGIEIDNLLVAEQRTRADLAALAANFRPLKQRIAALRDDIVRVQSVHVLAAGLAGGGGLPANCVLAAKPTKQRTSSQQPVSPCADSVAILRGRIARLEAELARVRLACQRASEAITELEARLSADSLALFDALERVPTEIVYGLAGTDSHSLDEARLHALHVLGAPRSALELFHSLYIAAIDF